MKILTVVHKGYPAVEIDLHQFLGRFPKLEIAQVPLILSNLKVLSRNVALKQVKFLKYKLEPLFSGDLDAIIRHLTSAEFLHLGFNFIHGAYEAAEVTILSHLLAQANCTWSPSSLVAYLRRISPVPFSPDTIASTVSRMSADFSCSNNFLDLLKLLRDASDPSLPNITSGVVSRIPLTKLITNMAYNYKGRFSSFINILCPCYAAHYGTFEPRISPEAAFLIWDLLGADIDHKDTFLCLSQNYIFGLNPAAIGRHETCDSAKPRLSGLQAMLEVFGQAETWQMLIARDPKHGVCPLQVLCEFPTCDVLAKLASVFSEANMIQVQCHKFDNAKLWLTAISNCVTEDMPFLFRSLIRASGRISAETLSELLGTAWSEAIRYNGINAHASPYIRWAADALAERYTLENDGSGCRELLSTLTEHLSCKADANILSILESLELRIVLCSTVTLVTPIGQHVINLQLEPEGIPDDLIEKMTSEFKRIFSACIRWNRVQETPTGTTMSPAFAIPWTMFPHMDRVPSICHWMILEQVSVTKSYSWLRRDLLRTFAQITQRKIAESLFEVWSPHFDKRALLMKDETGMSLQKAGSLLRSNAF